MSFVARAPGVYTRRLRREEKNLVRNGTTTVSPIEEAGRGELVTVHPSPVSKDSLGKFLYTCHFNN